MNLRIMTRGGPNRWLVGILIKKNIPASLQVIYVDLDSMIKISKMKVKLKQQLTTIS